MTSDHKTPLLKGFHFNLAACVPGRDEKGWKLSEAAWIAFVHEKLVDSCCQKQIRKRYLTLQIMILRLCRDQSRVLLVSARMLSHLVLCSHRGPLH